ncbi:dUTP diphosphatase [Candidatus Purcelliella pentastirinorum]|uniref:Deoxyuridine 5'-triphosphate nucleotidohydrolase n=1 Tax=Candidatus Purcelliella pentastirinorum TaxID=472834 RepID=A0AAX3N864_9ENTR|nr:dUTP diphosphatase [Candidatus Purcelliella pentastirinorum]WDI78752.1 dUTP diphosphatase [Candidatus Purcelliella pentastirinorum]
MLKIIDIKIIDKRIGHLFPLPEHITLGSAGLDLRACVVSSMRLFPGMSKLISAGLAIHINDSSIVGLIMPRSGLGHKYGIILGNSVGVIDSDYQGELFMSILNRSEKEFVINPGDRVAQIVFFSINQVKLNLVQSFNSATSRGDGNFGHSGFF